MILVISNCKEKLHELEFVRPIEQILNDASMKFSRKHYKQVSPNDLKNSSHIILCGTSLKDNNFLENLSSLEWIKSFDKPILGICAGMQVMGAILGGKVKVKTEIGFYTENFKKNFLGLEGKQEVWHLHNNYLLFDSNWGVFSKEGNIVQAVKHKTKPFYGVLFHPEVRNKNLILEFVKNG
ncbi:gamma-glutamyl-gamma-aminobutyrate hydrolase family protein [Candidatus Pacearchaeota archaeon]|nr:gamma-glutamyl-gamma-aminobutyrate hydrolase family protein [Candidatus Pacearchaeota archaeon]